MQEKPIVVVLLGREEGEGEEERRGEGIEGRRKGGEEERRGRGREGTLKWSSGKGTHHFLGFRNLCVTSY